MKKEYVIKIVKQYLANFPEEKQRIQKLLNYLESNDHICDWNNVNGHLTAGGFLFARNTNRFLVLYHKDLDMFLYPGGHCENKHKSPLETAEAEVKEETGISNFKPLNYCENKELPIDIDTHVIPYNKRVNMPEHYHFDFRYLFFVENEPVVTIDQDEMNSYKWIDAEELANDKNYGNIIEKVGKFLDKEKH